MTDERSGCSEWAIVVAAGIQAVVILLWIGSFAIVEKTNDLHFTSDVELPLVFLAAPAIACAAGFYLIRRSAAERSALIPPVLWLLLVINFIVFIANSALVSGGV